MKHVFKYDAIVIGGGHAGAEAASAIARMGGKCLLLTMNIDTIGHMSCNPAIGGMAKGHLVKEIDALGGIMGKIADGSAIHYKRLNTRKGPAVRSSRAQIDMRIYRKLMQMELMNTENLFIKEALVERLILQDNQIEGVEDVRGVSYFAKKVIITTGTFLRGICHVGLTQTAAGRAGSSTSITLAQQLEKIGLRLGRMKTGTTPRLDSRTIDFSKCEKQNGDTIPKRFSFYHSQPLLPQVSCYIAYTNPKTHEIIEQGLDRSPLFTGVINGVGPRYCPSIEDKIVRFADKTRHHIFLEPQGLHTNEIYPNGISTSLPYDVQVALVRSIDGLENTELIRAGYAVEYDYVDPTQLDATLEVSSINGLFLAGQINGTSGYEEAAAQGLIAGINVARQLQSQKSVILRRDQAYIAVLIDDLTTKGTEEPYRMFTSRAEYRLLLREDNADRRLTPLGHEFGLISKEHWAKFEQKREQIAKTILLLQKTIVGPNEKNKKLMQKQELGPLNKALSLHSILRRPKTTLQKLDPFCPELDLKSLHQETIEAIDIEVRYAGYLDRQRAQAKNLQNMENVIIPRGFNYDVIHGLSSEVREKLEKVLPSTLGQASRIPGVTPAAITNLWMYFRKKEKYNS